MGGSGSKGIADNNYNDEDVDEDDDNGHDDDDMKNIAMMMMMMGWPTSACCRQEQQVVHQADSTNGQLPLEVGEAGGLLQALASALVLGRALGQNLQQLVGIVRKPTSSSEDLPHNLHPHHKP